MSHYGRRNNYFHSGPVEKRNTALTACWYFLQRYMNTVSEMVSNTLQACTFISFHLRFAKRHFFLMMCVFVCVYVAKCMHLSCVYVVNALDLTLTTNQSDGWRVPHKRTEIKQISVEIKQTFPSRKLPSRGRRAAEHCSLYVSLSGVTAATTSEVVTRSY